MANRQSIQNDPLTEKPNSASMVMATLTAVTRPAPKRMVNRSLWRLDRIVPADIIMDTAPAQATGTSICLYITGQAAPSRPSGSPRLIKDRYIITSSN